MSLYGRQVGCEVLLGDKPESITVIKSKPFPHATACGNGYLLPQTILRSGLRGVLLRAAADNRPVNPQPSFNVFLGEVLEQFLEVPHNPALESFD